VLRTLSGAIRKLIDSEIPSDEPGLIAYDSYWQTLRDNPSFRSVPEIKEVVPLHFLWESSPGIQWTSPLACSGSEPP